MFHRGNISARRFLVQGPVDPELRNHLLARLSEHAHCDPVSRTEGTSSGWCSPWSFLDRSFNDLDAVLFNHYVYGGLRMDTYAVNSALKKELLAERIKAWCKEHDKTRCPRTIKEEFQLKKKDKVEEPAA